MSIEQTFERVERFKELLDRRAQIRIGDALGPAMEIADQEEADQYFRVLVAQLQQSDGALSVARAEEITKSNLGYWAGYYDNETRERVERLFHCSHPVFGSIAERGAPTAAEAFAEGCKIGSEILHGKRKTCSRI